MPQLKAAKKDLKQNQRRRVFNDRWRSAMREAFNEVRDAVNNNDKKKAAEAYTKAQKTLDRAARRNVIHPNKAARKKARLLKAVAGLK